MSVTRTIHTLRVTYRVVGLGDEFDRGRQSVAVVALAELVHVAEVHDEIVAHHWRGETCL